MEMAVYAAKKKANTVKLQKLSKNFFQLIATRYNPDTADEDSPEVMNFNFESIASQLKEIDSAMETLVKRKENILELKADMEALK